MTPAERLAERTRQRLERARMAAARAEKNAGAEDTRRKILLGSWVLSLYGGDLSRMPGNSRAALDAYLTRPSDRRALGFAPRPANTDTTGEK